MLRFPLRLLVCLTLLVSFSNQSPAEPATAAYPIIDAEKWAIENITSFAYESSWRKAYVGSVSRDRNRLGLYVFDVASGETVGEPRRYSDHPDPLTPDPYSYPGAMLVDARHKKLFLGIRSQQKGFNRPFVVYDLDDKGEPVGKPRALALANTTNPYIESIALHPQLDRLYIGSWGNNGVFIADLDKSGNPLGEPVLQTIDGGNKQSVAVRADGSKLYMTLHGYRVQVVDLDAEGNATGAPRTYQIPVPDGAEIERFGLAVTDKAVYFRGPNEQLGYFLLDAKGEPFGEAKFWPDVHIAAVGSTPDGRVWIAKSAGFNDAVNGKWISDSAQLQELRTSADGTPLAVASESTLFDRRAVVGLSTASGIAAAVKPLSYGFLGSRIAGLRMRVTLTEFATETPAPGHVSSVQLGALPRHLYYAYSPKYSTVYAASENGIAFHRLQNNAEEKVESTPLADADSAIALDEAAGVLYIARKDGTVAVRQLDASGTPSANGENLPTGINPIFQLRVNPKTHHLYVVGNKAGGAPSTQDLPGGGAIVPVVVTRYQNDVAVDAARGRLYASTTGNGGGNLQVWKLTATGLLAEEEARVYADRNDNGSSRSDALRVDAKRRKLYLASSLNSLKAGAAHITVYDLDEAGDPSGTPRFYTSLNSGGHIGNIEISANRKWLYETGYGDNRVFAWPLDEKGEPQKQPVAVPVVGGRQALLTATPDGSTLLMGGPASKLEKLSLHRDGTIVTKLDGLFRTDVKEWNLGGLAAGEPSPWIELDEALKNRLGVKIGRLQLSGAPVTRATLKFEVEQKVGDAFKPFKTVTSQISGPTGALFLPGYGVEESAARELVQDSVGRYRQYLAWAQKYALKPEEKPRRFIVANGVLGVDSNPGALPIAAQVMSEIGHNTLGFALFPNSPNETRAAAAAHGFDRFWDAVYRPPAYFDYETALAKPEYLDKWVNSELKRGMQRMGAKPEEIALFHISDEPGWYYPSVIDYVIESPERLGVFRAYLKSKQMTPQLLGKNSWDEVLPIKPTQVKSLPDKRLHFWTVRFYVESLSGMFSATSAAIQRNINPKVLTATNFNNWPNHTYRPMPSAPIAGDHHSGADYGIGGSDWFDLGRKKGVTCLWTQDWFSDKDAAQWSIYGDMLRCAAREGNLEFGGYVVGQSIGAMRGDGGKYKIMALAGHGAKVVLPYTFGPLGAFGDAWSEDEIRYEAISAGLKMLGKSERLLHPGRPRNGTVALLLPQASQVWDADARGGKYYLLSELYGLHSALIHQNYPVDFVDDAGLEEGDLARYKYSVLYVTAPNLSLKAQQAVLDWVQAGGTVVLLPGAVAADEYNEPTSLLWDAAGAKRDSVPRDAVPRVEAIQLLSPTSIQISDARLGAKAVETKFQTAPLTPTTGKALASFEGGKAAIVASVAGKGRVISFGYWPGTTYWNSPDRSRYWSLPRNWDKGQRDVIDAMARFANTKKHVEISHEIVEGALLESDKGVAVTLLNWSANPLQEITVMIANPGKVSKVESVEQGVLKYQQTPAGLQVKLPLKSVDVLMLSR